MALLALDCNLLLQQHDHTKHFLEDTQLVHVAMP